MEGREHPAPSSATTLSWINSGCSLRSWRIQRLRMIAAGHTAIPVLSSSGFDGFPNGSSGFVIGSSRTSRGSLFKIIFRDCREIILTFQRWMQPELVGDGVANAVFSLHRLCIAFHSLISNSIIRQLYLLRLLSL